MRRILLLCFFALLAVYISGCLTVETKEYSFTLTKGSSGEGRIKYINIMRVVDSAAAIEADYEDLINNYLKGNMPENEMSGVKNVSKRLFEEDNKLCGEITFEFDDIRTLKFYNYTNKMWAYYIGGASLGLFSSSETFFSSNGTYGEKDMPVIFWDNNEKEFLFKTVTNLNETKTESLLGMWQSANNK